MVAKFNKILILGSGTSTGIPTLTCNCRVCTSNDPKDRRLRSSIYLTTSRGKRILIDTTPDLRTQFLTNNINEIDFVIITHDHADHIHGIDDLRPFCFGENPKNLDIHVSKYHAGTIKNRFQYIFNTRNIFSRNKPILGGGIPRLKLRQVTINKQNQKQMSLQNETFTFFHLPHNYTKTMCFVHENFAYLPDCYKISDSIVNFLRSLKLEILIIDCLQHHKHDTHLEVERCFEYIKRIAPESAGLIHMNHHLGHNELSKIAGDYFDFPVFPVYDGLTLQYANRPSIHGEK
ncbi:MAG: MBL fold metallo-hydrolase [Bacteriovoracaceae bacterium]|nr:MBL fold metallo-hydrolase [Bacteriovoracaceae bacterium]